MSADQWWTAGLVVLVCLAMIAVMVWLEHRRRPAETDIGEHPTQPDVPVKYEVMLTDWDGEVPEEMRWRWTVWDADRYERIYGIPGFDPYVDSVIGCTSPYMLGNAPTEDQARTEAQTWIEAHQ